MRSGILSPTKGAPDRVRDRSIRNRAAAPPPSAGHHQYQVQVLARDEDTRETISRVIAGEEHLHVAYSTPLAQAHDLLRRHPPDAIIAYGDNEAECREIRAVADACRDAFTVLILSDVDWPPDMPTGAIDHVATGDAATVREVLQPLVVNTLRERKGGLPPPIAAEPDRSRLAALTAREREVLELTAEGLSIQEIADRLHRSFATVAKHRDNIMKKTALHDRVALARFAIRMGLVKP